MATAFDRWEKDPFFYAAEEVQEAADRMESVYRRWMIHEKRLGGGVKDSSSSELRRELYTALGTVKWQLDDLERAVRSSDHALSSGEATVTRHSDFVDAIWSKISMVEKAIKELNVEEDRSSALAWVRLDEGETDELAMFLSYPKSEVEEVLPTPSGGFLEAGRRTNGESSVSLKNSCSSIYLNQLEMHEEKMKDHQRVASACGDLGVWKISISTESSPPMLLDEQLNLPPPRIFSLPELRTGEAVTKPKWYRNGFRKCKALSYEDMEETIPLQNHQLTRGMDAFYAKSKSCLNDCTDESYNKQLYGWLGAFQRRIQRSQYQIKYRRPIQMIIWTIVAVLLIVLFVLHLSSRSAKRTASASRPLRVVYGAKARWCDRTNLVQRLFYYTCYLFSRVRIKPNALFAYATRTRSCPPLIRARCCSWNSTSLLELDAIVGTRI